MSRLTYEKLCEILQSADQVTFSLTKVGEETHSSQEVHEAIQELQRYKDLEEQGLLLELPCKVGDTVWILFEKELETPNRYIERFVIDKISITKSFYQLTFDNGNTFTCWGKQWEEYVGSILFPTKEAAEAKLKELKGE